MIMLLTQVVLQPFTDAVVGHKEPVNALNTDPSSLQVLSLDSGDYGGETCNWEKFRL